MIAAANTAAARALVAGLARAGVRDVCITPGSRSTPLTIAFAQQTVVRPWLHLDERSSAFFALGLAQASGRPVALVCTSGTAAANYHPAVAEADLARVPLVVMTSDRPPSLRGVGAPQTIDQLGLYGTAVRWFADLPLPRDAASPPFEAAGARAVGAACGPLPGPVHLNVPFDEPLIDDPAGHPGDWEPAPGLAAFAAVTPSAVEVDSAARALAAAERPLLVAGPEAGGLPANEIAALAAALDSPVLADPLSGLRTGEHDRSRIVDAYDAFLRDTRAVALAPDAVVRFGAAPTSKALNQFLQRQTEAVHVLVDRPGSWRDPNAVTTHAVAGDAALAARALTEALPSRSTDAEWVARWRMRDRAAREALVESALAFADPFEGRVALELQAALPAGAVLVAGNSMPVRDADSFVASDEKRLSVFGNRGANGIDGVVSTALGAAAAGVGPVTLFIGDLSLYHDLNGLWAAKRHALDLTVVLVNNDGGGIFHYLPQAAHGALFEEWFGTPSGLEFRPAVEMYGGTYVRIEDWPELRAGLAEPARGLRVFEVRTDRERNRVMHAEAWAAACAAAWTPKVVSRA